MIAREEVQKIVEDYEKVKGSYILTKEMLTNVKDSFKVMHPLPRVNEISTDVDNTPYAYYYLPIIEELLENHPPNLADFLHATLSELMRLLHLDLQILRSSELGHNGTNEALITEWCQQTKSTVYAADSAIFNEGRVDEKILLQNGITCKRFAPFPDYHILHSNRYLSILYFLFQFGPEAGYMLRQYLPITKHK